MEDYLNASVKDYLSSLSDRTAAPGGGSAAAAVLALGISLLSMSANFTVNKPGYEQYSSEISKLLRKLINFRDKASALIAEDAVAYNKVKAAYALPAGGLSQQKVRQKRVQTALKAALAIPYKIFLISLDSLYIADRLSIIGNRNLISDVYCGLSFLKASMEAAVFNMDANLNCISDKSYNEKFRQKYLSALAPAYTKISEIFNRYES